MQSHRKEREDKEKKTKYYVVREKAVPEVLLKVVEAKRILDSERATPVQEAAEQGGLSRSSCYRYNDDMFPFHDQAKGRTVTFIFQNNVDERKEANQYENDSIYETGEDHRKV